MLRKIKKNLPLLILILAITCFGYFFVYQVKTFNFNITVAHAQASPPTPGTLTGAGTQSNKLHNELNGSTANAAGTQWVFDVWHITMGLANAFVAIILLFFAFVNIAHIEYDTYQLKKTLPKLIIGIMMANFSMVICRMLVDVASVLTATFAQTGAVQLMWGVLCSLGLGNPNASAGGTLLVGAATIAVGVGALALPIIWVILIMLAILIGIMILGLLLLVRHAVILILAAVAPLAFILLAFPPTESYFKKWWEWWINYVFMGPIMMLLLWMAGMVGGNNCGGPLNITRSFAALALVYLAAIVPFKLGGTVMGAWGNLGKKAGSAAWNNPWSERQKKLMGSGLKEKFSRTRPGNWMSMNRAKQENKIANNEGLVESRHSQNMAKVRDNSTQAAINRAILEGKSALEDVDIKMQLKIDSGDIGDLSAKGLKKITGSSDSAEVLGRWQKQNRDLKYHKDQYEKDQANRAETTSEDDLRDDKEVRRGLKAMLDHGSGIDADVDLQGNALAAGTTARMSVAQASDAEERLRIDADGLQGPAKQAKLAQADKLKSQIAEFKTSNQTYAGTGDPNLDGQRIDYDKILGKNAAGRRHKVANVAVYDDAKTKSTSASASELVNMTESKRDAAGNVIPGQEALTTDGVFSCNEDEMDQSITGQQHLITVGTHRREAETQVRTWDERLQRTSGQGADVAENVAMIHQITTRVDRAQERQLAKLNTERASRVPPEAALTLPQSFSEKTTAQAADAVRQQQGDTGLSYIQTDILDQFNANSAQNGGPTYTDYAALTAGGHESAALRHFDISKTDMSKTGSGPEAAHSNARKAFRDGKVTAIRTSAELHLDRTAAVNLSDDGTKSLGFPPPATPRLYNN